MNVDRIRGLVRERSGDEPETYADADLAGLEAFTTQADVSEYLRLCLPKSTCIASDVSILNLSEMRDNMCEGAAPGGFLKPFGYLVVATSVGGNAVCFHSPSGSVVWANHDSFRSTSIAYEDKLISKWVYFYDYTPENVAKALVSLSPSIENFLLDLLSNRLSARLDELDH
jgi:hypothetical protein